ncbi:hypothetical protein F4861DRAFT_526738 [Xylaria intraflava]|nr:hypothetical protein F4861DRAFT_526738 [Xylaria intraflava]
MAPRKAASKTALAGEAGAAHRDRPSATTAPKRITRTYRTRQKSTTPVQAAPSEDGLIVQGDVKQAPPEVPDGIPTTSDAPLKTNTEPGSLNGQTPVIRVSSDIPKPSTSPDKAPSVSQGESPAMSSSCKDVPIKEQNVAADSGVVAADEDKPDESTKEPMPKKRKVDAKPPQRLVARKSRSKWDDRDEMLTNTHAPLVDAKLRDLLCSPKAWDILTREEADKILAQFPDDREILNPGTPNARPDIAALLNNDNFRHDVVRYQEGLAKGFHDPDWIRQAQAAHRSRQLGFYDEFMAADFEERWEIPMPGQPQPEPVVDKSDNNHPDHVSSDSAPGPSAEPKPALQHEDVAQDTAIGQDTDNLPKHNTADTLPENSIEGQRDGSKDANDDEVVPADTSKPEGKESDQPLENGIKQGEQAQVEAVTAQGPTELGKQESGDPGNNIATTTLPSLPDVMEGVKVQKPEEPKLEEPEELEGPSNNTVNVTLPPLLDMMEGVEGQEREKEITHTETRQNDGAEEAKPPQVANIQTAVEPAPTAESKADEAKDENTSNQETKPAEAPTNKRTRGRPRKTQPARKKRGTARTSDKNPST